MNDYKNHADGYRKMLEQEKDKLSSDEIADINTHIKVLNQIAEYNEREKFYIFDSGIFNDILKGYIDISYDIILNDIIDNQEKEVLKKYKTQLMSKVSEIIDIHTSEEAEMYYKKH